MGPGRLTGMNADAHRQRRTAGSRFNGARSIDRDERAARCVVGTLDRPASMGPGRLAGMNVPNGAAVVCTVVLQWGPVD